jgi:spore coat protein JB
MNTGANDMNGTRNDIGAIDTHTRSTTRATDRNTALLERIQKLSFVKCELELYLDTHPTCRAALDYYRKTIEQLEAATTEYHNLVGPIVASGVMNGERWTWVDEPWPWFRDDEKLNPERKDVAR